MINDDHSRIITKITALSESAQYNQEKIKDYREKIAALRQEIRNISQSLKQQDYENGSDELAELDAARSIAITMDCDLLRFHIDKMETAVKDKMTSSALEALNPIQEGLSLLKKRVEYISNLEDLIKAYNEEIGFSKKLKQIEKILEIDQSNDETTPPNQEDALGIDSEEDNKSTWTPTSTVQPRHTTLH
ncbi:hypothetical protein VSS37_14720 [Candidatus Thiothrix sp. Deng01]|uniref:Uncharacterized protein n=1 Tax=Candidatus Thiothrix phosphatis TaxID=3112415 RepID=A0ABU6CZI2_9GAMM|nr:hypothetical protein [Candidatus Thiothrix sp. Deng01]MEB4592242.1 hypothetical protein [Candidatus Thiothrix sp. Deng01]